MKIYLAHARGFDYESELYAPIRACADLPQDEIILPHENGNNQQNTREFYANLDLLIAEVSYPATGLGIELGWAHDSKVPIACLAREGAKVSGSLYAVTDKILRYRDADELINLLRKIIRQ